MSSATGENVFFVREGQLCTNDETSSIVPGITPASPLDLYDYPWSHSLLMALVWSLVLASPWLVRRQGRDNRTRLD